MALWSRGGFLIPVLWACGFWVYAWFEQSYPKIIPDERVVTVGHLVGTIFVWLFVWIFGYGKAQQMVDVDTQEAEIIRRPHAFMMISAPLWGLILTLLTGWMLYQPPPKAWYDRGVASFQQGCAWVKQQMSGKKGEATNQPETVSRPTAEPTNPRPEIRAAEPTPARPMLRDWKNDAGKTLKARYVRFLPHADGDRVLLERESGEQIEYQFNRLSVSDQEYVRGLMH